MGNGASLSVERHVVVVGAGYGGTQLAFALKKYGIPFTIINSRDSMHHNIASLRAAIEPSKLRLMYFY